MKKITIGKIIFAISLIPFLALFVYSVSCGITGTGGLFGYRLEGFDAFRFTLGIGMIGLSFVAPVMPICLMYQVSYIGNRKMKKNGVEKKNRVLYTVVADIIAIVIYTMICWNMIH